MNAGVVNYSCFRLNGETNGEVIVRSVTSYGKMVRFTEEEQFVY